MSAVLSTQSNELISYNPATGAEVGRVAISFAEEVKAASTLTGRLSRSGDKHHSRSVAALVMRAREVILAEIRRRSRILISDESGKPFGEAISMEIAPVLDLMQYFRPERGKAAQAAKDRHRALRAARPFVKDRLSTARRRRHHPGVELSVLDPARRGRDGGDGGKYGRHQTVRTDAVRRVKDRRDL